MDDHQFQLSLSATIVSFVLKQAKESGKGPGHALQALESITVGLIAVAAHEPEWEDIARELAKNVQERLSKMRAMKQRALN
mgnify:CR=1 FL=1